MCNTDKDAALLPFFEHGVEPPLCAAVRLSCQPEVIRVLLQHGADVNMTNLEGKTALSILSEPHLARLEATQSIANLLRTAGARDCAAVSQSAVDTPRVAGDPAQGPGFAALFAFPPFGRPPWEPSEEEGVFRNAMTLAALKALFPGH